MFINCYIFLYDIDIRDLLDFHNYFVFLNTYDLKETTKYLYICTYIDTNFDLKFWTIILSN